HEGCAGRQNALDAGAGQAATADPAQAAHPRVAGGDRLGGLRRAVGRIVIYEDRFPRDTLQRSVQPAHEFGDIVALIVGGKYDGQLDGGHAVLLTPSWWQ